MSPEVVTVEFPQLLLSSALNKEKVIKWAPMLCISYLASLKIRENVLQVSFSTEIQIVFFIGISVYLFSDMLVGATSTYFHSRMV